MPRQERDREDLLAEARALVERVSLRLTDYEEPVVVGFRRDGSPSVYFGPERVYQFTSGKLRRAYVDGLLYKAELGRLIALRRRPTDQAIELVRRELRSSESQEFLGDMARHFDTLRGALAAGKFEVVGQVPAEGDIVGRVRCWLDSFTGQADIAQSPRVG